MRPKNSITQLNDEQLEFMKANIDLYSFENLSRLMPEPKITRVTLIKSLSFHKIYKYEIKHKEPRRTGNFDWGVLQSTDKLLFTYF